MPFLDFEGFPSMLARNQALMAAAAATSTPLPGLHPPQMKKSRKSTEPRPRGGSPTKEAKKLKLKSNSSLNSSGILAGHAHNLSVPGSGHGPHESTNNNYDDDEVGGLKIDEDADPGKENLENKLGRSDDLVMDSSLGGGGNSEMDHSNGVSEEEEEPSMPGPAGGELAEAASKLMSFLQTFLESLMRKKEQFLFPNACHFSRNLNKKNLMLKIEMKVLKWPIFSVHICVDIYENASCSTGIEKMPWNFEFPARGKYV